MARTQLRGTQVLDSDITKDDLNITLPGKAVICQVHAGTGITLSSTGVDPGTGDVTINAVNSYYRHTQSVPMTHWFINHQLGKFPSVTVHDSANETILGDVEYIDINTLNVVFGSPFSGEAYIN
jgi:hypothetical protein